MVAARPTPDREREGLHLGRKRNGDGKPDGILRSQIVESMLVEAKVRIFCAIDLFGRNNRRFSSFLPSFFLSPFNLIQFNFDKIDAALSVSRRPSPLPLLRDLFHVDARKIIARRKVFYRCVDAMLKREIELQTGWSGGF